ncbi:Protein RTF2 [Fasciolopsis buskii]|uniref:Replication termination factor 2 n=1 Tax=Fasciolopsis buskii TaxID=27845 RepID=A0A8E0RNH9_9TREM|nr:Protein RTF2 [Fasciolopsis buski]
MGGDGGSIPRREELVRSKQKPQRAERRVVNAALWRHCALTQDPLRPPIVSCRLGRLYNKESVINKLLSRSNVNQAADHIRKLKDVRELRLTAHNSQTSTFDPLQDDSAEFYCPITGLEMSGAHAFVYLWTCGCVFSKKALETVQDKLCMTSYLKAFLWLPVSNPFDEYEKNVPLTLQSVYFIQCGTPFTADDVILLNPQTEEEIEAAKSRLLAYQQAVLNGKAKKRPASVVSATSTVSKQTVDVPTEGVSKPKKSAPSTSSSSSGGVGGQTAGSSISHELQPSGSSHSIQEDPNVSSVYKSLFTTSEEAKRQPKSHWVTFNPLYFR